MSETFTELNDYLKQAEEWTPVLDRATADQIMSIVIGLDGAQARVNRLLQSNARYPAEEIQRIEIIESALRTHLGRAARVLNAAGIALETEAQARAQTPEGWWWRLPQLARERRQQMLRAWLLRGAIVALIVVIGIVLYNTFFAPDPIVVARSSAIQDAQQAIFEGRLTEALDTLNNGLAEVERLSAERPEPPDTVDLLTYRGVVLHQLGREEEAAADFAAAEAQSELEMRFQRVQAYLLLGDGEAALADAQRLVEIVPEHPAAYLFLGDAHAALGQRFDADQAYAEAEELAFSDDEYASIYVLVKQRRQALWNNPVVP